MALVVSHDRFALRPAVGSKLEYLKYVYPLNLALNFLYSEANAEETTPSVFAFDNLYDELAHMETFTRHSDLTSATICPRGFAEFEHRLQKDVGDQAG
ncbi:MAG: hypothetical protein ACRDVC_02480 [Acidimicrobiales bacterium]